MSDLHQIRQDLRLDDDPERIFDDYSGEVDHGTTFTDKVTGVTWSRRRDPRTRPVLVEVVGTLFWLGIVGAVALVIYLMPEFVRWVLS